jgi:excisionase family DNA binding protein
VTSKVVQLIPRPEPDRGDDDAPVAIGATAVYTVKEVSTLLTLSLGSTYALIRQGAIPALRLGGRWVVPKRRFHAWLDGLSEDADQQAPTGTDGRGWR